MTHLPYGFRVVGHKAAERRSVDWRAALAAYCRCDPLAEVDREVYLSHFIYPVEFRRHTEREGSEQGYNGPCAADWLFWDVDRPGDLAGALRDARRLAGVLLDRYRELDDDGLLLFVSGRKGFHVGVPTALWNPEPSPRFNEVARRFCSAHAERAGVAIDVLIYSKTRLFRAPNSRHPSGCFKRRLTLEELTYLTSEAIVALASEPEPFDVPAPTATSPTAADDWSKAVKEVERRADERRLAPRDNQRLAAMTLDFIRQGAPEGERALRLFRAAANLGEFDWPAALAHALLTEAALDSGLTPGEARRQIECGLAHAKKQREGETS